MSVPHQSNYMPHDQASYRGIPTFLWSQELFMLLNKPFITVIWIFFTLEGAFVCLITGRQENKNSSSLWKTHKPGRDVSLFNRETARNSDTIKEPSRCVAKEQVRPRLISPQHLGCLIFSGIVFFLNVAALLHCPLGSAPICGSIVLLPVADILTGWIFLLHSPNITHGILVVSAPGLKMDPHSEHGKSLDKTEEVWLCV